MSKQRFWITGMVLAALVLVGSFAAPTQAEAAVNTYNVVDFGANGSDTSSDRLAIQTALDKAKTTSEEITVIVPAGTYYIDDTLNIYSDTTLQLDKNAVIKRASGIERIMLANVSDSGAEYGGYNRTQNITVTGGTWDGTISNPTENENLLYFGHAQDVTVSNMTIKNCYGVHLLELTGVKDAVVSNVTFDGFKGTGNAAEDAVKEALQLDVVTEDTSSHYAPYDATPCKNITIENCSFNNYPCAIGSHTIIAETVGVTIDSCEFKNISNYVIQMNQYSDVVITANTVLQSNIMPVQFLQFINSEGEISYNTITGTQDDAIYLNNSNADLTSNMITNSGLYPVYVDKNSVATIVDNYIKGTPKNGVHIKSGSATVNGNIILDCDGSAIYAGAETTLKADANDLSDCGKDVICADSASVLQITNNEINNGATYGIFVEKANANTLIKGNSIYVTGNFGILTQGPNGAVIDGNRVSGISEYGIYVRESATGTYASNVTVCNNTITGGSAGIAVRKARATAVKNNTVENSSVCSIYVADTCTNSVVTGNTIGNELGVYDKTATVSGNKGYVKVEVKQASDGNWYYYENGKINYSFNGLAENSSGLWKIEKGKVNFGFKDLYQYDGVWYYIEGGKVNFNYTGLTNSSYGWWYIEKGIISFKYTNLVQYAGSWWYVQNSQITFKYDGLVSYGGSNWYIEDSKVDFSKNGLLQRGDWYYFKGGAVDYGFTGLTNSPYGWWYIEKGKLEFDYTDLVNYGGAWWYVQNSNITFKYDGVVDFNGSTWYIEDSKVDFGKNGLLQRGDWYYFKGGAVDRGFTGLTNSPYGWWYIEKGKLEFDYTNLVNYGGAWWYVQNSNITFKYDGVVDFNGSTWYIEDSKVDFGKNGLHQRGGTWYLFKGGAVNRIDSVEYYGGSWWYVENGVIDFSYDGIGTNASGSWYIKDGRVDFSYTGTAKFNGKTYTIKNGQVIG